MAEDLKHVVIIGAGFGGLSAAKALAKAPVMVTIIDKQNHHLFQPLLYQVATAALTPADIAMPIRRIFRKQKNARVVMDRVVDVDTGQKCVLTESGQNLPYDALVIATGARHSYFGNDQWAEDAPGLKTLDDALKLRETILCAFEKAELVKDSDPELAKRLQTFVVIGAGPTGVEMAGAIAELGQSIARDFRKISAADTKVLLLEGGPRVLPSFKEKLSARAEMDLTKLGVTVMTETMVTDIDGSDLKTNNGDIQADTVIWAAGVQASRASKWLGIEAGRSGHVTVDGTLRPEGFEDVYVIGDTAHYEENGRLLPGVAPVAKQMGQYVGKRLSMQAQRRPFDKTFHYWDSGSLATIGRNKAVVDMFGVRLRGFLGWILWGAAHVYFLIGFKNRLFVTMQWIWSYISWQRGVRLIMQRQTTGDEL